MSEHLPLLNGVWRGLAQRLGFAARSDAPPPGAESGLGRLLWTDPRPLIHTPERMIVVFSPKSACTSVLIWFYHQIGHYKAARDYGSWPHNYRTEVYYRSRFYRRAFQRDLSKFSLVRVIRDPFERAVSSFRHAQKGGLADAAIGKALGRRDMATAGLSFAEFLDFLAKSDLRTCDPHFRIQRHPIEDHLPTAHLINASTENLFTRLNQVEIESGLPLTDFTKLEWLRKLNPSHTHAEAKVVPADAYNHRFTREEAGSGTWPPYAAFLTPAARERLARLYAIDVKAYGSASADRRPATVSSPTPLRSAL